MLMTQDGREMEVGIEESGGNDKRRWRMNDEEGCGGEKGKRSTACLPGGEVVAREQRGGEEFAGAARGRGHGAVIGTRTRLNVCRWCMHAIVVTQDYHM